MAQWRNWQARYGLKHHCPLRREGSTPSWVTYIIWSCGETGKHALVLETRG